MRTTVRGTYLFSTPFLGNSPILCAHGVVFTRTVAVWDEVLTTPSARRPACVVKCMKIGGVSRKLGVVRWLDSAILTMSETHIVVEKRGSLLFFALILVQPAAKRVG